MADRKKKEKNKTGGGDNKQKKSKLSRSGAGIQRSDQEPASRRRDNQAQVDDLYKLLENALRAFPSPSACCGACEDPYECNHEYDDDDDVADGSHNHRPNVGLGDEATSEKSMTKSRWQLALESVEREHLPSLRKAETTRSGRETLLHVMANKWTSGVGWSPKQKRFLGWMLQHDEFRLMLDKENESGYTPMHIALEQKLDEFVDCVLEASSGTGAGGIINILRRESTSAGNCFHLATKHNFPHLKTMLERCAANKDVLVLQNRLRKDTPLHIAVNELRLPVLVPDDPPGEDSLPPQVATLTTKQLGLNLGTDSRQEVKDDDDDYEYGKGRMINVVDFSPDLDEEDDEDYHPHDDAEDDRTSSSCSEYEDSEDGDDPDTAVPKQYQLETDVERRKRLLAILEDPANKADRPRPPISPPSSSSNHVPREAWTNAPVSAAPSPASNDLPPTHNVRLLVEANPEALEIRNEYQRTPYQEREEALLADTVMEGIINDYVKRTLDNDSDGEDSDASSDSSFVSSSADGDQSPRREQRKKDLKAWAQRILVVRDPVAHYIRSYCVRHSQRREETMARLYKPGRECHIEFDLAGMPKTAVPSAYLDQLALHLKFESILKYVALPALSIEREQSVPSHTNSRALQPNSGPASLPRGGRSDLVAVFDWLWRNGVREIIKVMVVDDRERPHADSAIVEALYGFRVEEWDWKRVDLCSEVIYEAAGASVREVSLYSSGHNAVLMGWASPEGLGNRAKFPRLEKVTIYVRDGLEDSNVRKRNTDRCKASIEGGGGRKKGSPTNKNPADGKGIGVEGVEVEGLKVEIIPDKNKVSFSSEFHNAADGRDPPWIESIQRFSSFLKAASDRKASSGNDSVAPIKIAIIDDGIDATVLGLQPKIVGGATFCPYPHSSVLVNSYFVPSGKHGTLMAQLISRLCPDAQLYIARLEELPASTGSGRRVTARSAAQAVEWARNCGVNIISMSWTIQTTAPPGENPDLTRLKNAIQAAHEDSILMFCSASDQGADTPEKCYPGDWHCALSIGGATFSGDKLTWVDKKVDFWFPGRNVPFTTGNDTKTVVYESGSSVATAAASGLAAVLLYSARLVDGNKTKMFQGRDHMETAFRKMASGTDGKFPRTTEILGTRFTNYWWIQKMRKVPNIKRSPRGPNIEEMAWDEVSELALKDLLNSIALNQ